MLLGGRNTATREDPDEVWVSEDGTNWQQSLPPMSERRVWATALNTGSPEYLVVAGDLGLHTIEVLVQGQSMVFSSAMPYSIRVIL